MKHKRHALLVTVLVVCLSLFQSLVSAQRFSLPDTLIIGGVGDIMTGSSFPSELYLPPANGSLLFTEVNEKLRLPDLMTANLEGSFLDTGKVVKKCQDETKCYAFRIPEAHAGLLWEAGFDALNLANNHTGDFGQRARERTLQLLDSLGIGCAGLESRPWTVLEKNGVRYGFCGFSPFTGSVDMMLTDTVRKIISRLDSLCDIVIVSLHAGAEGAAHRHVTRASEIFYDEDRGNVHAFAHMAVDAGADIVFGHGPHVPRAVEVYKDRFIAYSLGNFCTWARFNLKGANGLAPLLYVYTDSKGRFLMARVFSYRQLGEGGPVADETSGAWNEIMNLTREDFPESDLDFSREGYIFKRIQPDR